MKKAIIVVGLVMLIGLLFSACNNTIPCPVYVNNEHIEQMDV